MNVIFVRHAEATDNVKEVISDREIYWSILTEKGEKEAEKLSAEITNIDKIYVSPLPRTVQTASYIANKNPDVEVVIENRIREINSGKYSHCKNNKEQDATREKHIAGDYFARFGEYGENKYAIEERICSFLEDVQNNNFSNSRVVIVSHGSVISYMKRMLNIHTKHIRKGGIEEFANVDFAPVLAAKRKLKKIKADAIRPYKNIIKKLDINLHLKKNIAQILNKEFNNLEFSTEVIQNYLEGITCNIRKVKEAKFSQGVILVCVYNNCENMARKWIEHYISIGIKNFVLVDNNSKDNTNKIFLEYSNKVNISFFEIKDIYNCYKMCGWKQQILEYYGEDNYFLTVDSDELFIYPDYEKISLDKYILKEKITSSKAIMLDTYPRGNIYNSNLEEYIYVDKDTYKITNNVAYGERIFGGPRERIFGIKPSLQKIPLIYYTGREVYINDHYYYPWKINNCSEKYTYLLHYKFLPEDAAKYLEFAKDGRHWNNSREYKIYIKKMNNISFYNSKYATLIKNIKFERKKI